MNPEDEESVDVELLAECGQIAHRLRSLEWTWAIDLKDLQKKTLFSENRPTLAWSKSVLEKLNETFNFNERDVSIIKNDECPGFVNRLQYLEDTVIKIHHQQELLKHTVGQKRTTNNRKLLIKSNMNYSTASTKNNNNDLTISPSGTHELKDYQNQQHESRLHSSTTTSESCSSKENSNKILWNDDVQRNQDDCIKKQQIYHQQQQLCAKITSEDLRMLIRELRRKVDFTEKMNWLCKYTENRLNLTKIYLTNQSSHLQPVGYRN